MYWKFDKVNHSWCSLSIKLCMQHLVSRRGWRSVWSQSELATCPELCLINLIRCLMWVKFNIRRNVGLRIRQAQFGYNRLGFLVIEVSFLGPCQPQRSMSKQWSPLECSGAPSTTPTRKTYHILRSLLESIWVLITIMIWQPFSSK